MVKAVNIECYSIPADRQDYVDEAARLRGLSATAMLRRVLTMVIRDRMILSVLDDDDKPAIRTASERKTPVPAQHAVAEARQYRYAARPATKYAPTRGELRDQLTQALVNTGGARVSTVERRAALTERMSEIGRPASINELGGQNYYVALQCMVDDGEVSRVENMKNRGLSPTILYELRSPTIVAENHLVPREHEDAHGEST